jgi:hypothetical protein
VSGASPNTRGGERDNRHPNQGRDSAKDIRQGTDKTGTPAQLRRRREAAWRSEPLHDGYRDPLDRLGGEPIACWKCGAFGIADLGNGVAARAHAAGHPEVAP